VEERCFKVRPVRDMPLYNTKSLLSFCSNNVLSLKIRRKEDESRPAKNEDRQIYSARNPYFT
jgi:hypothetical protein